MTELQSLSLYGEPNPFTSGECLANSNYTACVEGSLLRLLDWRQVDPAARMLHSAFREFVQSDRYSCLGARAAVNGGHYRFGLYRDMGSVEATSGLARDLCAFVAERPLMPTDYATYVAFFSDRATLDEETFERALWKQIQALHEIDKTAYCYNTEVSSDPESSRFAFSFAREAFFIVGMHPGASRIARRFAVRAIAFNAHALFKELRAKGIYDRFKSKVRDREHGLQGSLNPNLSEFGEASEARQYSGRPVEETWKCPFRT